MSEIKNDRYLGQHLIVKRARGSYTHHGLGIGRGKVVHYSGLANDFITKGIAEVVDIMQFSKGAEIKIKPHPNRKYSIEESILRANLRMNETRYHVVDNNCEHFVAWCITGRHRSPQSIRGKLIYSAGMGVRGLFFARNPIGFLAGAVAGYALVHHQGNTKMPDFERLEKEFELKLKEDLNNLGEIL